MSFPIELNKTNVLVLVPAYNEQNSIKDVLVDLQKKHLNILVVDDGSSDSTRELALQESVKVLTLPFNLGVGGALRAGFVYARRQGYQAVIQVDADGQHDVTAITSLIKTANITGAHMVVGSRFHSPAQSMNVGLARRLAMRFLATMASKAANTTITDATSGFRLIREPLLTEFSKTFPRYYLGDTYEALISAGRAGYDIREISTVISDRRHGSSSASRIQSVKFLFKSVLVAALGIHSRIKPFSK
jgi:glycosyltransferase involved in cell wall biosynthesis